MILKFFWNTVKSDTINITKDNLASTYDLDWTESVDVDGDSIVIFYLINSIIKSRNIGH